MLSLNFKIYLILGMFLTVIGVIVYTVYAFYKIEKELTIKEQSIKELREKNQKLVVNAEYLNSQIVLNKEQENLKQKVQEKSKATSIEKTKRGNIDETNSSNDFVITSF